MSAERAKRIASAFLPDWPLGNRYHYYYARAKLRSDPLYPGVCEALRGTRAPLLDLGCGLGLLAHALHEEDLGLRYFGVDHDARKIVDARRAASRRGLADAGFETQDLSRTLPPHRGSVAMLDVLQFFTPERQQAIVDGMIGMLEPGTKLVIRTGLDDGSGRGHVTRITDRLSHLLGWMKSAPRHYPDAAQLRACFDAAGLRSEFSPLAGDTPFNNWLVVASRD
ncbi:methyltransferase domain-containing protein [Pseudoxanthomonas daejeonensis]|uniref:methyltransferase domain-containing protein n=1 Tax=Pseudoxanthomonas daejeonensis TaxID=266062 RepID=UPI0013916E05|nr:methyltransferase domain-containing protein [Pseudoxanthomonas daejeonensis]UNK59074.1 methyltransferase domain-containing protein [Pseudoxanthomonas daejeonensis]